MMLSAILFGLALTAFGIIDRQFHLFDKKTQGVTERDQFLLLLNRDVAKADYIRASENELVFLYPDYELNYSFEATFIQRRHSDERIKKDTFYIGNQALVAFLGQNVVNLGAVDQFSFELKINDNWFPVLKRKNYTAFEYMNIDL